MDISFITITYIQNTILDCITFTQIHNSQVLFSPVCGFICVDTKCDITIKNFKMFRFNKQGRPFEIPQALI